MRMNPVLDVRDEVREALGKGRPVVALESTVISHGMPYPRNIEAALRAGSKGHQGQGGDPLPAVPPGRLAVDADNAIMLSKIRRAEEDCVSLEQTLVLIKPDGFHRGLVGEIISRLEKKGLRMRAAKMMKMDEALASRHYGEHAGKDFYEPTVRFMTSAPIMAMVWEGRMAIAVVRQLAGKTNSALAEPGTIRGDYSLSHRYNLIHAADGAEAAEREIKLFFPDGDFLSYQTAEDLLPPFDIR